MMIGEPHAPKNPKQGGALQRDAAGGGRPAHRRGVAGRKGLSIDSIMVHAHEIVANRGVSGNGQKEYKVSPTIDPIPGTNYVPRDIRRRRARRHDAHHQRALPHLLRRQSPQALLITFSRQNLITRSMFPASSAGDYSYAAAEQFYNGLYVLREPSKTFRLTVATTF